VTHSHSALSHDALADHDAGEPLGGEDFRAAMELMEKGVYLGDLPLDIWQSLRRYSPGALAAMVSCG